MGFKLSDLATEHIQDIWLYTDETWGEAQATAYTDGLFDLFAELTGKTHLWRAVPRDTLPGLYCARYREHIVFFRRLPSGDLGILAVLHGRRDMPQRLKEMVDGGLTGFATD